MDDLLQEFLTETAENLDVVDSELVRFEADPDNAETLNNIFRLVHTIKGTCGFLGLVRLENVAHAGETLLGKFRDGVLAVTPDAVTLTLKAIDRIKAILIGLQAEGVEPPGDDSAIIDALHAMSEGKAAAIAKAAAPEPHPVGPNGERWDPDMQRFLRPGEVSLADLEAAFLSADGPGEKKAEPAPASTASAAPAARTEARVEELEDEEAALRNGREPAAQTIRVSVDVLEQLMTTVSELVLTRNQLLQMVRVTNDSEFKAPLQRLSNITAELQDRVMKTRMQPVGGAWRKLPRIVRDICRDTGKKIDLVMEGEATELDRQVLELIRDPLTHMIRNSADHGIEAPDTRAAAGKAETGVIKLSAHHEGGHIIILVADDGAGLNTERIRAKAVERGIVTGGEAATMSGAQVHQFIFAPGFSTAAQVTNLSGRGVGMDVVRTNIEVIGGSIELSSQQGRGTTFQIKVPLTLAIVSALVLGARGQRFAAPQTSVLELVRVGEGSDHQIDSLNQTPVLRLRDRLLPLVNLIDILQLPPDESPRDTHYIVVMQAGAHRFGVVVDEVCDTEEIVVKPLATLLRGASVLSGATILGDGSVVVILDPNGLAANLGRAGDDSTQSESADLATSASDESAQSLILFRAGSATLKGVPLRLVTRLEELDVSAIEAADGRAVIQYRGALMPVTHAAGDHCFSQEGKQAILVFTHEGNPLGVAVDEIVDIIRERVVVDLASDRPGVIGAAVIRGKATEIIDVGHYIALVARNWKDRRQQTKSKGRLLLVDQSDFTRHLLTPLLEAAGYQTQHADSYDAAYRIAEQGPSFDVILTDVDADPAGAENFARRIDADPRHAEVAKLALSREVGAAVSFADVVPKTDRASLLAALEYVVSQKENAA